MSHPAGPTAPRAAPTTFDEAMLALPLYESHHRELAGRIVAWCDAAPELRAEPLAGDVQQHGALLLRALAGAGWLAFLDPDAPEHVRRDGDARSLCLIREALAYAGDLADFAFSIQALAATPIVRHGSGDQQRRYLPGMAAGTIAGSFAISEQHAGSDVSAIALRAERTARGYVLEGRKTWIANAGVADLHCVVARTGEGPGVLGLTAFLVPADTPGVHVEATSMIAPRAIGDLVLEGCHVRLENVLGRPGRGFVIAMEVLERFRMTVGAAALGFARRGADAALARARSRPMQGGRLIDLQLVQATFADIEVKLSAASLLVARAAWELDRGGRGFAKHSSIAKLYATEVAQEIVDASLQVFGAAGLVRDSVTERLYREIRSLRVYEGASDVQRLVIAGALDRRRG